MTVLFTHFHYCIIVVIGEWISGAVCAYIVDYLVVNYGNNEDVRITTSKLHRFQSSCLFCLKVTKLLDSVEFIFIPFVNPDGYVVSHFQTSCH